MEVTLHLRDEGGVPGIPLLPGKAFSLHTQLLLKLNLGSKLVTQEADNFWGL